MWLCVQDIFSRRVWAEPTKSKEPENVAQAFRKILGEMEGDKVYEVTGDRGQEFLGAPFQRLLEEKHIAWRPKLAPNDTPTLDAAINSLKRSLFKHFADGHTDWPIQRIVDGFNKTPQFTKYLGGGNPNKVWFPDGIIYVANINLSLVLVRRLFSTVCTS